MTLPVLYSFRRCPYAMRARLGLAVAGIQVELREILLRDKPPAMLALSAKGTVPVLQLPDGEVIDESRDILDWALRQNDPQGWRQESERATTAALIAENDGLFKHWLDRSKYFERYPEHPRDHYRAQAESILAQWEQRLAANGGGLLRAACGQADYALLPFVRQYAHSDDAHWEATPFPHLQAWLRDYEASPLYRRIMPKWPVWPQAGPGITVDWSLPAI